MLRFHFGVHQFPGDSPALFLDRDGVINRKREDDYVLEWSQFEFLPGVVDALRTLSALRRPIIVISNQAAVGKGILTPSGLEDITTRMDRCLSLAGVEIAAYYYCTHRADEGCQCRKPGFEMLCRAAEEFNLDLPRSVFVGDSESDVQAARGAQCQPVLFRASGISPFETDVPRATSPQELVHLVTTHLGSGASASF